MKNLISLETIKRITGLYHFQRIEITENKPSDDLMLNILMPCLTLEFLSVKPVRNINRGLLGLNIVYEDKDSKIISKLYNRDIILINLHGNEYVHLDDGLEKYLRSLNSEIPVRTEKVEIERLEYIIKLSQVSSRMLSSIPKNMDDLNSNIISTKLDITNFPPEALSEVIEVLLKYKNSDNISLEGNVVWEQ